jgi:acyl transferase domain-containing protein/short-subunit dehydrogenase/acyl carrier protein
VATERGQVTQIAATQSAARLAVAVRQARTEAGASAALLLSEPIAIVGMGCRFPGGADTPAAYWRLLDEGRSGIREIPEGRWAGARERLAPHMLLGGYLEGVDRFDAEFFGIAPREAHSIDPQQRLLLEVCWEALSDAGIAPSALSGTDTGVFIAVYSSDYARMQLDGAEHGGTDNGTQTGVGAAHSVAAGRVSFLLNLRGPCMAVDTACSSSLVATHLACQSLRQRECSVALVGSSSLKLLPDEVRAFAQWGMLAGDGRAKTFDAKADGFVPGEGAAVVVLKRLSDAVAQGDRIRAVIRGAAVGHDGRSSVLTAPNGPAQEAVMRAALKDAQVMPGDVSLVETHGTGTSLGDPIEVEALDAVYGAGSSGDGACLLGAVKTNFGHLEASAGLAGVIKTVLALEQEAIPRNLNFQRLNPQIQLAEGSRLQLATEGCDWPRAGGRPRFAAVSSFGLGGTNAHVILEEAPVLPRMGAGESTGQPVEYCLPISAHTAEGLLAVTRGYLRLLGEADSGSDWSRITRAAARGRDHAAFRMAVSGESAEEIAEKLEDRIASFDLAALNRRAEAGDGGGKLAFVFTGQGSLWLGMLKGLLRDFPEAAKVFEECERLAVEVAGWSLKAAAEDLAAFENTAKAQPLQFAVQMALVRVLENWGVRPDAVTGHSVGEVAAAVTAGVLTLEEGMRLVLKRGRHMGNAETGRMLAAEMSEAAAASLLLRLSGVELAAVNGPKAVVFAGPIVAMEALAALLREEHVATRWLDVQYAFHSAAMEKVRVALEADLEGLGLGARHPSIALVSTVTGGLWRSGDGDAAYWGRGIRERVRFREAVDQLLDMGCGTVLEIGAHPALLRPARACAEAGSRLAGELTTLAVMRRGYGARATLMTVAGRLYEQGRDLEWAKVYPGAYQGSAAHVDLPAYPWNRKRYWFAESPRFAAGVSSTGEDGNLTGREVASAFVEGWLREMVLETARMPWLGEHCFESKPILPFTAWLEMARRAAVAAGSAEDVTVREFAVSQRLELSAEPVMVQTLVGAEGQIRIAVRMGEGWQEFAAGFWEPVEGAAPVLEIAVWESRAGEILQAETIYEELETYGLTYGPAFRLLRKVHAGIHAGNGFALGEIADGAFAGRGLHPAVLDACLQTIQAAQRAQHRGARVLPVSVGSYRVYRAGKVAYALAEMKSADEAEVTIADERGEVVAEIRGLRVRRIDAVRMAPMWRTVWTEVEPAAASGSPDDRTVLLKGALDEVAAGLMRVVEREKAALGSVARVCVRTCGAVAVFEGERVDPGQAAVLGLVRSFRAEYPGIAVQLVDTREDAWLDDGLESCEIAIRNGRVLRPRLERVSTEPVIVDRLLKIGTPGLLETLSETEWSAPDPEPHEVQIAVVAHGLNFRDVLTAMGTYQGALAPLGAECSGMVVKAGADTGVVAGTAVVAFSPGSLRSVVNVAAPFVIAKPEGMSYAEAATVPVAFLTAHYGFSRLAGLTAGQTVLVHSAAGGLGQAAVQLARRAGATVIATAGTAEKRELLRMQGVEHVFDSRSDAFADDVLRVTEGRGVDVVLNALSGEKIAAGFRALTRGGTFLEVGKRDIWSAERVAAERPDALYRVFDLGEVALREPGLIQMMLREIFDALAQGELKPLPLEVLPIGQAERAFRQMASGRHVGKLVLTRAARGLSAEAWRGALRNGSVVITGGTGALGLATARWLLAQDAKRIVLVSRGGGSDEAARLAAGSDGRVVVERADVSDREQLAGVLERSRGDGPLRVVIHAVGEVDDRLLADHSVESFELGLRIKVEGARLLAELTTRDELAVTVYYSSMAALLGSAGQASYAAANAFLDGMAEERSARGLRTLSVNWGAWADGGMVAELSAAAAARVARQGMRRMAPPAALEALGAAILGGNSRAAIGDVDWDAYHAQFPQGSAARGFFDRFLPAAAGKGREEAKVVARNRDAEEITVIWESARAERLPRMEAFVRAAARKELGLSSGRPMPADLPLQELGLDSLMALELRNILAQAMGRPLSATLLFDYPTIRGLAGYLLSLLAMPQDSNQGGGEHTSGVKTPDNPGALIAGVKTPAYLSKPASHPEAELAAMSDAEAEELLLAELDGKAKS